MALSGTLWPAHPKPLPDEILSSWIVRVAEANGIKLQRMCWDLFGNGVSPWNRDVDRSAPKWLLKAICNHTGTSYWEAYRTTLTTYRTLLYSARRVSGQLRWILPIRTYGMTREGFGQQFCPQCLASDPRPYFRKSWRVALFTFCPEHQVMLHDACPACGLPVAFHRRDFGVELEEAGSICSCYACGFDFRAAPRVDALFPTPAIRQLFHEMLQRLLNPAERSTRFDLGYFDVLHQLCRIMGIRQNGGRLMQFVSEQIGVEPVAIEPGRVAIEQRRVDDRHRLLLCAIWLMAEPFERVRAAWEAKAVLYNHLLKDMDQVPKWYRQLSDGCSNWRKGFQMIKKVEAR